MPGEFRIDDLARAAGTTVRNVRAYTERGLLMPPIRREGRAAIYDDSHLERLALIDSLLQRGFTTAHIADFITSFETGKDLTEVLGLQHAVTARWSAKRETIDVPLEIVQTFLGADDAALLDRLVELDLARVAGGTVTFTAPDLLEAFAELHGYGVQLRDIIEIFATVTAHVSDIATLLIGAAKKHIVGQHGEGWLPDTHDDVVATTAMLNSLRTLGVNAVHAAFAKALDDTLQTELGDYLAQVAAVRTRRKAQ